MTASPSKALGLAVLLAAIALPPPAWAQTDLTRPPTASATPAAKPAPGAPVPLTPPVGAAPSAAPSAAPAAAAPTGPAIITPAPLRPGTPSAFGGGAGGIVTGELSAVDPDAVGLLNGTNGGYGMDMWRGTTRGAVMRALPLLPSDAASPAMHEIVKRLLLTVAPPPPPDGVAETGPLTPIRLRHLVDMGETAAAISLSDLVADAAQDESARLARVDALFIDGRTDVACGEVRRHVAAYPKPYWQKAMITCQLLAGDADQATIGMDLLRESRHDDPAFFAGAEALIGLKVPPLGSLAAPTPMHLTLLSAGDKPLPADVLKGGPGIQRALAINPKVAPEIRLRAAETAVAFNVLAAADLSTLYKGVPFKPEELAQPLTVVRAPKADPLRSRALLHAAFTQAQGAAAQAELINAALEIAAKDGAFIATARLYADALNALPKAAELVWFSGPAARALYSIGDVRGAAAWYDLARANPDPGRSAEVLWPLVRLAERQWSTPWPKNGLANWRAAQSGVSAEALDQREMALLNLLLAFGEPLDGAEWNHLTGIAAQRAAEAPNPAVWHALENAAADKRVGETVMLAMAALGDGGPSRAAAIVVHQVVKALLAVGLEAEARMIALEAALATGA